MILDLASVSDDSLRADVVIVGSGVVGSAIAAELSKTQLDVLVLEAGPDGVRDARGKTIESVARGRTYAGLRLGRRSGYGGTGARWAGQCAPFDPIDFEHRDWIAGATWPVKPDELHEWYEAAARALRIDRRAFDAPHWESRGIQPAAGLKLSPKFSVFSARPNIAALNRRVFERSRSVRVLTHAMVSEVQLNASNTAVESLIVLQHDRRKRMVFGSDVIIAAGGIESARLLLMSNQQQEHGLGNRNGMVGMHLHDHPNCIAGDVETSNPKLLQDMYAMLYRRQTRYWARIPLAPNIQRDQHLLNANANLIFDHGTDSAVSRLKALLRRQGGDLTISGASKTLAFLSLSLPSVLSVAWRRYVLGRSPSQRPHQILLQVTAEQLPLGQSKIALGNEKDEWGLPKAEVTWTLSEQEWRAQRAVAQAVDSDWRNVGLARVTMRDYMDSFSEWCERQSDAYHHSGTTRMSDKPADGVVDRNCQVHGITGLYVAGTSVLPTSSHSNPTFTAVALGLRLAAAVVQKANQR